MVLVEPELRQVSFTTRDVGQVGVLGVLFLDDGRHLLQGSQGRREVAPGGPGQATERGKVAENIVAASTQRRKVA